MNAPKPMEVDKVYADWGWWEGPGETIEESKGDDEATEEEEYGVNFVGKGKGKGWWGKGVWNVEDEMQELDWEWDKAEEENEEPGPVNAIDYHKGADNMADGDNG